ncbi:histidine-phosphotransfer domain HPT domain-containing [Pyrrhoderma noxium]|uniref:Histidine-phosphotransfer domain HPT domain-containing n=1 Tax=Pyrrhoderma noxium TaxID=2282107 RepID=A0A286UCS7_9AGAM|nr:histidine-phosphotransfer domain HPT domain-containing [Pyrrhoderma noxium]
MAAAATAVPPPAATAPSPRSSDGPVSAKLMTTKSPPLSPTVEKELPVASSSDQPDAPTDSADTSSSPNGVIDMETFHQILDLDEDETHDFSAGMAWAYFEQAGTTFQDMEEALAAKDLTKLSSLGHFLKGSSAALGVAKVQASCERMQHYGQRRDEEAGVSLTDEDALNMIESLLTQVKKEYSDAEKWLREWYKEHGVDQDAV